MPGLLLTKMTNIRDGCELVEKHVVLKICKRDLLQEKISGLTLLEYGHINKFEITMFLLRMSLGPDKRKIGDVK